MASYHKNYTPNLESIVILVDQPEESIHSPSASKGSFLHQEYLDPRPRKISSTLKAKIDHQKLFMLAEKQLETNQEGNKSKDKNQIMKKAINRMNFKEIMKKSKENQTKAFLKSKMDTSKEKGKPPQISSRDQKPAPVNDTNQKGLIAFSTKPQIGSSRRVSSPPVCKPINTSNRIKKPSPSPKPNAGINFNRLKTFDTAGPCSASRTIEMPSSFSGIFSKKPNPNLVGVKECTRESSRKSSLGKKKQYSKTSEGDTRPQVNIKIENKDFIAKLMNINIIKIKPDLKNNQCYCRTTNSPNKTSSKISKDRRSSNTKISGINNIAGEKHVSVSLEKLLVTSKSTARNKSAGNQADNMVLRKKGYNLIGVDSINTKKISKTSSNIHKTSEINRNYTKDSSRISSNDKSKGLVTQNEISIVNNEQGQGNKPSSNQRLFSLIKNMHDSPLTDRQFRPMKRKPTIPVTNEGLKENIRKALEAKHRR